MTEAKLEDVGSGLAPVTPGWFVVNAEEAAWIRHAAFGSGRRAVREQPARAGRAAGCRAAALPRERGSRWPCWSRQAVGTTTPRTARKNFFVLAGTCRLIVLDQERDLRAWDFVHLPPGSHHTFVGTGDGPCVILMIGARREGHTIIYPRSEAALAYDAGVETETPSPQEAYAASSTGSSGAQTPGPTCPGDDLAERRRARRTPTRG